MSSISRFLSTTGNLDEDLENLSPNGTQKIRVICQDLINGGGGGGNVATVNNIPPVNGNVSLTSADIPEQTNLYYTDNRADARISNAIPTRGDLLTRDAIGPTRLPIGTNNFYLRSDGNDPTWGQINLQQILNMTPSERLNFTIPGNSSVNMLDWLMNNSNIFDNLITPNNLPDINPFFWGTRGDADYGQWKIQNNNANAANIDRVNIIHGANFIIWQFIRTLINNIMDDNLNNGTALIRPLGINHDQQAGADAQIINTTVNNLGRFRTLTAGTNITITQNDSTITINSTGGGVTYPLLATNGSQSAPSYSFASGTQTGFYWAGTINITVGNNLLGWFSADNFQMVRNGSQFWGGPGGAVNRPQYSFRIGGGIGSNSGLYLTDPQILGISFNGVSAIEFDANRTKINRRLDIDNTQITDTEIRTNNAQLVYRISNSTNSEFWLSCGSTRTSFRGDIGLGTNLTVINQDKILASGTTYTISNAANNQDWLITSNTNCQVANNLTVGAAGRIVYANNRVTQATFSDVLNNPYVLNIVNVNTWYLLEPAPGLTLTNFGAAAFSLQGGNNQLLRCEIAGTYKICICISVNYADNNEILIRCGRDATAPPNNLYIGSYILGNAFGNYHTYTTSFIATIAQNEYVNIFVRAPVGVGGADLSTIFYNITCENMLIS